MAEKIVAQLKKASHDYYETGKPSMTDDEYDTLKDTLQTMDPTNAFLNDVGSLPEAGRVALPFAMPSLKKVKPETLSAVKLTGPFVISDKLDGISALWTCGMNRNSGLFLRGDGLTGQDVSSYIKHVQGLKQGLSACTIRGELITDRSQPNARNWVNGVLHQSTPNLEDWKKVRFVAYQVLEPAKLTRSQQMTWLTNQGFEVAWNHTVPSLNQETLTTLFKSRRESSPYECDGLVIGTDTTPQLSKDASLPKDSFAYKVAVDDQRAETTVRAIEWASSRMGEWIPRVRFDPVKIGTATIEFCTGVHAQYVKDHGLGPGARIVIRRSGDVIPALDRVITKVAWQEPPEDRWNWHGIHAMDITPQKTSDTLALEMAHSLVSLGVEGLSATSTKKLVEGGFPALNNVWKATEAQIQGCIGKANGAKLRKALDTLDATKIQWIHAFPGWPKGFGERKITKALEKEENVSLWQGTNPPEGQTSTTFTEVCKCIPSYLEWREQFPQVTKKQTVAPQAPQVLPKQVGSYVMTGFRDAELSKRLEAIGWTLQERVNKETTLLLVADGTETTKTKAAKEKGIRILQRNEVNSLF